MTDKKIYADVKMMPIDEIKSSPFENANEFSEELFQSLKKDIEEHGLVGEVLVVNPKNNTLISGHHRKKAMQELGYEVVPVVFYEPKDEMEHKILSIAWNQKRGTFNEQRLYNLVKSIYDSGQYSLEELKDKLGFNMTELKEKLETIRIDEDLIRKINKEAEESEKNMPVPINFVLTKEQLSVVSEAMEYCESKTKADKITSIARAYLYSKLDDDKPIR
jgi:ParB/RepB/Spo0J family partition protein